MFRKFALLLVLSSLLISCTKQTQDHTGSVIFIHPDGTGLTNWNVARILYYGPDGQLNWDKMSNMAIYKSHFKDCLTASSHAGATVHSYGVKVIKDSYGMDGKQPVISKSGKNKSIMHEAVEAGIRTGLINTGSIIEPGTSAFVASVESRGMFEEIAKQVVESGVDILFSGGEEWFIPDTTKGFHCEFGKRTDGINLINLAKSKGYKIIYTVEELKTLPASTQKVLGLFSEDHTFNDKSEAVQKELGLAHYKPNTPTVAEMTEAAIRILSNNNTQFYLVIEEEATDNFSNYNNAGGLLEAMKRSDDAIGVALDYVYKNSNTLLLTAADSEAGGMEILGSLVGTVDENDVTPVKDKNGNLIDGSDGQESGYFFSAPDQYGQKLPFRVTWAQNGDGYGSVIAKAHGLNADMMKGLIDNTYIYKIKYYTLFGKELK